MVNKPMPSLRKPSPAAAAAFVGDVAPVAPLQLARPESAPVAPSPVEAPVLVEEKALPVVSTVVAARASKKEAAAPARRKMSLYLSQANAKRLQLESVLAGRDMSDIVDDLLSRHLKKRAELADE